MIPILPDSLALSDATPGPLSAGKGPVTDLAEMSEGTDFSGLLAAVDLRQPAGKAPDFGDFSGHLRDDRPIEAGLIAGATPSVPDAQPLPPKEHPDRAAALRRAADRVESGASMPGVGNSLPVAAFAAETPREGIARSLHNRSAARLMADDVRRVAGGLLDRSVSTPGEASALAIARSMPEPVSGPVLEDARARVSMPESEFDRLAPALDETAEMMVPTSVFADPMAAVPSVPEREWQSPETGTGLQPQAHGPTAPPDQTASQVFSRSQPLQQQPLQTQAVQPSAQLARSPSPAPVAGETPVPQEATSSVSHLTAPEGSQSEGDPSSPSAPVSPLNEGPAEAPLLTERAGAGLRPVSEPLMQPVMRGGASRDTPPAQAVPPATLVERPQEDPALASAKPDPARTDPGGEAKASGTAPPSSTQSASASASPLPTAPQAVPAGPVQPGVAPVPTASVDGAAALRPAVQLENTIEHLATAREAGRAASGDVTLRHQEFGAVNMRLEVAGGDLRAVLAARDPGFVPAIQAALAERAVAASQENAASQNNGRGQDQSSSQQSSQSGSQGWSGAASSQSDPRYGSSPGSGKASPQPYLDQNGTSDEDAEGRKGASRSDREPRGARESGLYA